MLGECFDVLRTAPVAVILGVIAMACIVIGRVLVKILGIATVAVLMLVCGGHIDLSWLST